MIKLFFQHPAGHDVILEYGGRDATTAFRGHSQFAMSLLKQYEIGELPEKERIYRVAGRLRCDELPEQKLVFNSLDLMAPALYSIYF